MAILRPVWDFRLWKQPEIHMGVAGFTQDTVGEMCLPEVAARDETAHLEAYQLAVNTSDNLNQFTLPTMYSDKHFESVKYVE